MKKKEIMMFAAMLLACVVLFMERVTGPLWHLVLGIVVFLFSVVHLCKRTKKISRVKTSWKIVDILLTITVIGIFISGFMLHPMRNAMWLMWVHKSCGGLFFIGIIAHMIQKIRKRGNV